MNTGNVNILKSLPSKKLLAICIPLLGLAALGAFFFLTKGAGKETYVQTQAEKTLLAGVFETDTDLDGLKDWKEELWGTQKDVADTDRDGTSDGDEVAESRNPLIAGPDDMLSEDTALVRTENSIQVSATGDLNETETFSRELFAQYLQAKKTGVFSEEEIRNRLLTSFADDALPTFANERDFTASDVHAVPATEGSIRTYANSVAAIILDSKPASTENELIIFERAVTTGNREDLSLLDPLIQSYQRAFEKASIIAVPENAILVHVNLINSLQSIHHSVSAMQQVFTNPLPTLAAVRSYPDDAAGLVRAFQDLAAYVQRQNVAFSAHESWHLLTTTN